MEKLRCLKCLSREFEKTYETHKAFAGNQCPNDPPCPYEDVECENGHVYYTIVGTKLLREGYAHPLRVSYELGDMKIWLSAFIIMCFVMYFIHK